MDYKPRFCEVTDLHAVNVGISDILNVTWATYTESRVQMTKKILLLKMWLRQNQSLLFPKCEAPSWTTAAENLYLASWWVYIWAYASRPPEKVKPTSLCTVFTVLSITRISSFLVPFWKIYCFSCHLRTQEPHFVHTLPLNWTKQTCL